MIDPSLLSLLVVSCILQSISGQVFRGPGYVSCPFVDFYSTRDDIYGCIDSDTNCTSAQLDACSKATYNETVDASFQIYNVELPCECDFADTGSCPESCNFFTGEPPTLPPVEYVNYTGPGILTCPPSGFLSH